MMSSFIYYVSQCSNLNTYIITPSDKVFPEQSTFTQLISATSMWILSLPYCQLQPHLVILKYSKTVYTQSTPPNNKVNIKNYPFTKQIYYILLHANQDQLKITVKWDIPEAVHEKNILQPHKFHILWSTNIHIQHSAKQYTANHLFSHLSFLIHHGVMYKESQPTWWIYANWITIKTPLSLHSHS